jgi:hypothetical protein
VSPVIGAVIIAYVLFNTEEHAKIAGISWLVAGTLVLLVLKASGRSTALQVDPDSAPAP